MFDLNKAHQWVQWLVPIGIVACLMIIFVPLPPAAMDVLLAANITIAIIILLSTVFVKTPLELSIFPSLLLATTMLRLALNIATTRLILTRGAIDGELAAGQVIHSFGAFVAGNQIAVGLVIFAIIVVVQFVVITKGATRISEVSARFALDGMPGKQMAIDAELNAGNITAEQAKVRRAEVEEHADFYGAMDGASKFVRGDAIAGVLITMINIVGGLFIGFSQGMNISEAAATFTTLTIGDGLVSQLPALLISVAAGLLLTRGTRKSDLPQETISQLFTKPGILIITALFLMVMVFTKLPAIPLLVIAAACGGIAYLQLSNQLNKPEPPKRQAPVAPTEQPISRLLERDTLEFELGIGLIPYADSRKGGRLLAEIATLRQRVAKELGMILPKVRVRDNLDLPKFDFQILLHGNQVFQATIDPESHLAMDCRQKSIAGTRATNEFPWWPNAGWSNQPIEGTILPTEILIQSLNWVTSQYAHELLTRESTQLLIDEQKKTTPTVVEELVPELLRVGQIQKVLARLVFEGISIRPMNLILEELGDSARTETDLQILAERVRVRLKRQISHDLRTNGSILCFGISEELQYRIAVGFEPASNGYKLDLPSETIDKLKQSIEIGTEHMVSIDRRPILYVDQDIRPVVAWLVQDKLPGLFVLGSKEVSSDTSLDLIAEITTEDIIATGRTAA